MTTIEPRRQQERDGILTVMAAGNRLSEAVTIFHELGMIDIARRLDGVLVELSRVGNDIPTACDEAVGGALGHER